MAGFRVGRRHGAHEFDVRDADLAKRAGSALFAADERIRVAADELGFAEAELGAHATERAHQTLVAARRLLSEAFRLNRFDHEAMPGTAGATGGAAGAARERNERIVQLCERIEAGLDEQASALAVETRRTRRAPEVIAGVRADSEFLRARIPHARATIDRLAARYTREALAEVESNPAEAEQLLAFAEHGVRVAERRREAGRIEQGNLALEASALSVRRAATLLDAVEAFEVEALHAESLLAGLAEDCRRDLAVALAQPHSRAVATAIVELQSALAALPAAGVNADPRGHLNRLREAKTALDAATAPAPERATRPLPPVGHVHHAIRDADRQLDVARDAIAGHPGWIGAEARTRLAESEHLRLDLGHYLGGPAATITLTDEDHRDRVIAMARRAASLASESLRLARQDIDAFRSSTRLT